jgi:hypothetical protein
MPIMANLIDISNWGQLYPQLYVDCGSIKGARGIIVDFLFFMITLPGKNAAH